ncbi:MAG: hypothetical protein ACD_32C00020G0002 [uncultured bacterium]|nr:MAG: hypothetical protein ACD_32C00020G0002 [uncultured bacterium]
MTGEKEIEDLPVIKISKSDLSSSQKADWRIIKALSFLIYCQKQSILIDRILIDENKSLFHIFLADGVEVIAPQTGNASILAASLQIIISRFRIEGKIITKVDFQFDKPIVVLSNGEELSSNL